MDELLFATRPFLRIWDRVRFIIVCGIISKTANSLCVFLLGHQPQFDSGYLYFFSSLTQCAAAFAGLSAIFAVYRLQMKNDDYDSFFHRANIWLQDHRYIMRGAELVQRSVIEQLNSIKDGNRDSIEYSAGKQEAQIFLLEHAALNDFYNHLPSDLRRPLWLWAAAFILPLAFLLLFEIQILRIRLLVWLACLGLLVLTMLALWVTGKFVEKCLMKKKT